MTFYLRKSANLAVFLCHRSATAVKQTTVLRPVWAVNNESSSFDDEFQVLKARTNKIKYTVIIAVFCALVMYFLSALFAKAALLFYFLTALFVYIAMITGKMFVKYPRHFLYIKATENELQLAYYKDKKEDYHFQYNSIEEIRFADKNFTARGHGDVWKIRRLGIVAGGEPVFLYL